MTEERPGAAHAPTLVEKVIAVQKALQAGGVGHAFGGALALAYYVEEPRATSDIDVNVSASTEDPEAVFRLLPEGIGWGDTDIAAVRRDGQVRLWWGERGTGTPVDLFFPQGDLHQAVVREAVLAPFASAELPFLTATHLTVFKSMFARPKDWLDIEAMVRAGTVDVDAAVGWLESLFGPGDGHAARLLDVAEQARTPLASVPPFRRLIGRDAQAPGEQGPSG